MPVENPSDVARDMFGWAVATADFDGDGFDDLGATVPGEDLGDDPGARRPGSRAHDLRVVRGPHGRRRSTLEPGLA